MNYRPKRIEKIPNYRYREIKVIIEKLRSSRIRFISFNGSHQKRYIDLLFSKVFSLTLIAGSPLMEFGKLNIGFCF